MIVGPEILLSNDPTVEAECALIIWYDYFDPEDQPVVGEFSFRFKDKEGNFNRSESEAAHQIMDALATMGKWIDATGMTKTRFVYDNFLRTK